MTHFQPTYHLQVTICSCKNTVYNISGWHYKGLLLLCSNPAARITTVGGARSRSAVKENSSASIAEWTIDYIGVSSDPTQACHTSKDFFRFVVEHTLYDSV